MTIRAYYLAHRAEELAKRAAYRAAHLDEQRERAYARWRANRDRYSAAHQAYYRRLREEMLTAYGRACACCGEQEIVFLALFARGAYRQWRKKDGQLDTSRALRELRKASWPREAAQLLCRNCLWAVVRDTRCPHRALQSRQRAGARTTRAAWLQGVWSQALAAFGGACACCGESEPAFLTLDHVHGQGEAHRRALGIHDNFPILLRLRDAGWPHDGRYRLLCWSCQWGVQQSDGCPHQRARAHYAGAGRVPLPPPGIAPCSSCA